MGFSPFDTVIRTLKLLLPALIPSWRFFDIIAPSPRIEYALLESADKAAENWQEFRPRPASLSLADMIKRMLWNPKWNETLFLVSCAEQLMAHPTDHSAREIFCRIKADLTLNTPNFAIAAPYLQFRLVFLYRFDTEMEKRVTYMSELQRSSGAPS